MKGLYASEKGEKIFKRESVGFRKDLTEWKVMEGRIRKREQRYGVQ